MASLSGCFAVRASGAAQAGRPSAGQPSRSTRLGLTLQVRWPPSPPSAKGIRSGALNDTKSPPLSSLPRRFRRGALWVAGRGLLATTMDGDVGVRSCTDAELLLHPELLSQEFLLLTLEQVGPSGRLRTDGPPGGRAGLREARGRSPPTQTWRGSPPESGWRPGNSGMARRGRLRRPLPPVCKQRPAEEGLGEQTGGEQSGAVRAGSRAAEEQSVTQLLAFLETL